LSFFFGFGLRLFKDGKGGFNIFIKSTPVTPLGGFSKNIKSTPGVDLTKILNPPHGAYGVDLRSPKNQLKSLNFFPTDLTILYPKPQKNALFINFEKFGEKINN
jgi:hypothetical protein